MNRRQEELLREINASGQARVMDLAARFGVAPMTIRRDLSALEDSGLLVRTHGGAVPAGRLRLIESAFPHYSVSAAKEAIGRMAASMVQPGQTVMVDSGTTALQVALNLPQDAGITVATVSLCVAQVLYGSSLHVLLLGGFVRKEFPSLYGPMTERTLESLRLDMLFMGCDGADSQDGFYTSDLNISSLEEAMIRVADRVVVVTESSKFGRRAFVRYARPDDVDTLVTDTGLSERDRANLTEHGVSIQYAGPPTDDD